VDEPDHTENLKLEYCPVSGVPLTDNDIIGSISRQVFDIPKPKMLVTEYVAFTYRHPTTGELIQAPFPEGVNAPTQYGSDLKSLLVYLYDWHFIPNDRLVQLVDDLFGHRISPATVEAARKMCYSNLEDFDRRLEEIIKKSDIAHADETGFRVKTNRFWLHVACTQTATKYYIHQGRGAEAMDSAAIWLGFSGRLIHDCLRTYFGYECEHGLCNAHVIRELRYIHENMNQDWAGKLIDLLYEMKKKADSLIGDGNWFTEEEIRSYDRRFKIFITKGENENPFKPPMEKKRGPPKRTKPQNLLVRFRTYQDCFLAFLTDPMIPFTNNLAEQDLRMMKVQQKVSGCFRTVRGAQIFARIRSFLSTLRKNGQGILPGIKDALSGRDLMPELT
jgi:transposase